jgi:hypothetical protein
MVTCIYSTTVSYMDTGYPLLYIGIHGNRQDFYDREAKDQKERERTTPAIIVALNRRPRSCALFLLRLPQMPSLSRYAGPFSPWLLSRDGIARDERAQRAWRLLRIPEERVPIGFPFGQAASGSSSRDYECLFQMAWHIT